MENFQTAKHTWKRLEPGSEVTMPGLIDLAKVKSDKNSAKAFSSFLCLAVRKGEASRQGKKGRYVLYVKAGKPLTELEPKKEIGTLELGISIYELITDLKRKIILLQGELREARGSCRQLVEEKKGLELLLKKAQTRILELNNSRKGKTINLHELQSFRNSLGTGAHL